MKNLLIIGLVMLLAGCMNKGTAPLVTAEPTKAIPTEMPTQVAVPEPTPTVTQEPTPTPVSEWDYDVVVVGSGPGGFAASVQAARMGSKVLLIEESDWVGGQMTTAGVATMDAGPEVRKNPFGIYAEFVGRVAAHYQTLGKSIHTCYWSLEQVCFEPHVGKSIILDMLQESGVDLWLMTEVHEVFRADGKIEGIRTTQGIVWTPVLVDATEWGDVLGLIPGSYRLGEQIQDITWVAIIRLYPEGPPAELVMEEPPGYKADEFSKSLRLNGNSGWPLQFPVSWIFHNAYRGLPDSSSSGSYTAQSGYITKTGVNWFNDHPLSPLAVESPEARRQETCQAKLKTLQLLYYIQTEIDSHWAVADDEGYDTPYNQSRVCYEKFRDIEVQMPLIPYVREARRMVGVTTLLGTEIRRVEFEDAVAWGDYAIDLHGAREQLDFGESWSDIRMPNKGLFGIPMGVFISSEWQGLLAAEKNLSTSRLANGATRLQPVAMSGGQAAGAIAALWPTVDVDPAFLRQLLPIP